MTSKELGTYISRQRKLHRLSQQAVADHIGTTRVQISRIEKGEIDTSFQRVQSILLIFGQNLKITEKADD